MRFILIVLITLAAAPLHAAPVRWTLSNVTFSDGSTSTGSFVYDASTDQILDWDVTLNCGPVCSGNLSTSLGIDGYSGDPARYFEFGAYDDSGSYIWIPLAIETALGDDGGRIDFIRSGDVEGSYVVNYDTGIQSHLNTQSDPYIFGVAIVPIPVPLILFSSALGLLGWLKRYQAAQALYARRSLSAP